jgi:hypothetical protein
MVDLCSLFKYQCALVQALSLKVITVMHRSHI